MSTSPRYRALWVMLAGILVVFVTLSSSIVNAHELLPSEIVRLLRENPDLTEEDIEAYVRERDEGNAEDGERSQQWDTVEKIRSGQEDARFLQLLRNFIALGIRHILGGLDHVLFVLSLLLVFSNVRSVLKLVTAFTIAHSITFIVAGAGLLTVPARIVEPLIALSIAYVALTSVFLQGRHPLGSAQNKIATVFFFGLFHGLGFAGLLSDLAIPQDHFLLSLLAFNVGIEVGQLLILALVLPYLYLLRRHAWYPMVIRLVAIAISLLALVWTIERVFALSIL